ncbi:MAG TPA: hypothetical protein ENH10_04615 [Bacteroidetes bacterium]|nr:hypothetical protein BMS3Bbin04_00731 [bacterium BMS3Bbin04]HDO65298.1 hypothetical protein [Bacteroidota bacterium]HEX04423.1 hypothetical protein [Bacteroidota bacterium]
MAHPLVDIVMPEALGLIWHEHCHQVQIGPFSFPGDVSIPVSDSGNELAREGWLNVPFAGRPPVSAGLEGEGSDADATELLRAALEDHLVPGSPDHQRLVDEIARCLLIHSTFGAGEKWHEESRVVFERASEGATLFEILIRRAQVRVGEGVHYLQQKDGEQAMYEYLLARLLYYGAHLISPATPGVLYEMGVLTHDLAHQLKVDDGKDQESWKIPLAAEASHFLSRSLKDEGIRDSTPALFLLGANQETVGELKASVDSYKGFLDSPAANTYPHVSDAAKDRLKDIVGDGFNKVHP